MVSDNGFPHGGQFIESCVPLEDKDRQYGRHFEVTKVGYIILATYPLQC